MTWSRRRTLLRGSCTAVHCGRALLRALAWAACALVCSAFPARADGSLVPIPRLISTGPVRAGDVVEIRWDALPPGVAEMELVLSVDGGRHYPIRLSAEMAGRETSFRWRVPNLGTREARLRLRAHHESREVESESGSAFEIVVDLARPAELGQVHEGGWWTGLDPISGDARGLSDACPAFHHSAGSTIGEAPQRDRLLLTPATASDPAPLWSAARAESSPALLHSAAPHFRPRRE